MDLNRALLPPTIETQIRKKARHCSIASDGQIPDHDDVKEGPHSLLVRQQGPGPGLRPHPDCQHQGVLEGDAAAEV